MTDTVKEPNLQVVKMLEGLQYFDTEEGKSILHREVLVTIEGSFKNEDGFEVINPKDTRWIPVPKYQPKKEEKNKK